MLVLAQQLDEGLRPVPEDLALLGDVVAHLGQAFLVEIYQVVQGALTDVQRREGRQEIISYEEAKEDEVINYSLEIELNFHLRGQRSILEQNVLSQH